MHEPSAFVRLSLPLLEGVDYALIDDCLENRFGVEIEAEPPCPARFVAGASAFSLAWRVLLVARSLQQTARIPVFEAGRVLNSRRDSTRSAYFHAVVAVPVVDHCPRYGRSMLYDTAMQVAIWAAAHHADGQHPDALYRHVQDAVIPGLRRMLPAGISTVPILKCAFQKNIPYRHLGAGVFQLGWGARAHLMDRSAVDADSAIGSKLAQKKHWSAQFLRAAGLPAPEHRLVGSLDGAEMAAKDMGWPLVIKPADRDRSEGVTIGIGNMEALREASRMALSMSSSILVEREVPGICYRLLIANGRLLYALSRKPRAITGDGRHTIAELLQIEGERVLSKPPWLRSKRVEMDDLTRAVMASQGLGPDAVPDAGQQVALRRIESSEWGGEIGDATGQVHPDNLDIAVRAARLFGLRNAGIDIISEDISRPWHETGAIINEVNYAPYFGGNSIARARLPDFLDEFMGGDGRIPVIVHVGGDAAWQAGMSSLSGLAAAGVKGCLTSHRHTLNGTLDVMHFAQSGIFQRVLALLMNREVGALILVVQTDEFLHTGMPVDGLDEIHVCAGDIMAVDQDSKLSGAALTQAMLALLRRYEKTGRP